MDSEDIGEFLRRANSRAVSLTPPEGDEPSVEVLLSKIITSLEILPFRSYRNADGERDDIRGQIDVDTLEYRRGFRFFGSTGVCYRIDGRIADGIISPLDLLEACECDDSSEATPGTGQTWVHPAQRLQTVFFTQLDPATLRLEVGTTYLNRMGFVIELKESSAHPDTGLPIYRDQFGTVYDKQGQVFEEGPSMVDLAYKISHLRFITGAESQLRKQLAKEDDPEYYDPVAADREETEMAFFLEVLRVDRMAKRLNIPFGFHIFKP